MKKRRFSWIAGGLAGCLMAPAALGWGQPEHAVLGEATLQKFAADLPGDLSAPDTRETYVYACYSPDGFLFHGPVYVHLDRRFAVLLLQHAQDARQRALAYGWASHMEQDVAGHGRYIRESGLDHLKKEIACGTRVRWQGQKWEKKVIQGLRAVFDVDQVHLASADYAAEHPGSEVLSRRHVKLTGLGYSAYLTALHGVMFANYWGNLKWNSDKYPRSEWQFAFDESIGLTHEWAKDFHAFSRSSVASMRRGRFARLQAALAIPAEVPRAAPLEPIEGVDIRAEVVDAVRELSAGRAAANRPLHFMGHDDHGHAHEGDLPHSHVLVQDPDFFELGARILEAKAADVSGQTDGHFYDLEPRPKDARAVLTAMRDALGGGGALAGLRSAPGERGQFYAELAALTEEALRRLED